MKIIKRGLIGWFHLKNPDFRDALSNNFGEWKMKSTKIIRSRKELPFSQPLLKVLLACGILAALLYAGTDIVTGLLKPGYRFDSQSASILSAFGAATRPFVLSFNLTADILLIAFALGAWFSTDHNWVLRIMAGLLAGNAVLSMVAVAFFPMHIDEALNTVANTMNVILMAASVLLFFLAVGFGAAANKNWFRYFSIGLILVFFVVDILATLGTKPTLGGHPGPLVGIQERTMIYGELLWLALQAIVLLRVEKNTIAKT
jgi:hypothetical protein